MASVVNGVGAFVVIPSAGLDRRSPQSCARPGLVAEPPGEARNHHRSGRFDREPSDPARQTGDERDAPVGRVPRFPGWGDDIDGLAAQGSRQTAAVVFDPKRMTRPLSAAGGSTSAAVAAPMASDYRLMVHTN